MPSPPTSAERRAYLLARRDTLRAEQEQRAASQRRADELSAFMNWYGAELDRAGAQYEIIWPEEMGVRKTYTLYPVGFASIKWELVPHARQRMVVRDQHLRGEFDAASTELGLSPDTMVVVDWAVGGHPRIRLRLSDLSAHAVHLLRTEAWVYDPGGVWLIELHHDGWLNYADRPGLPEHAGAGWRSLQGQPSEGGS
jgi:hypothetical protein